MDSRTRTKMLMASLSLSMSRCEGKSAIMDFLEKSGVNVIKSEDLVNHGTAVNRVWVDEAGEITQEQIDYIGTLNK